MSTPTQAPRSAGTADRIATLTGVGGVLLLLAALIVEGQVPAADAPTTAVVRFYSENAGRLRVATLLGGLTAALLIWFGGTLYGTIRTAEGAPGRISMIVFGGMLVAATGFAMFFAFVYAAAETAGDVPPAVTHTIEVLAAQFFLPLVVGLLVALLATAAAILRYRALPRWLGYVSILVAIVFMGATGLDGAVAIGVWILAGGAWIATVSAVLFVRTGAARTSRR